MTHTTRSPPAQRTHTNGRQTRPPRRRSRSARQATDPAALVLAALASIPIVVAVVVALANGWTPIGDNATIALRSGDVLRGHPPLVGMPSTSDMVRVGITTDHPGPIAFFLLALPYRVFGPAALVVTMGLVNMGAVFGAVGIAWRRGARPLATMTAGLMLILCVTLGPTIIRDPLNSHSGLLPLVWLGLLAWDVTLGRLRSAPYAVLAATWCAQAHMVFLPMIAVLGIGTVALTVAEFRRPDPSARPGTKAKAIDRQPLLIAGALGLLLWFPPLLDQFFGDGNLGSLLTLSDESGQGLLFACRALLRTFGTPPTFLRMDSWPLLALEGPGVGDIAMAIATVALIIWITVDASRRADRRVIRLIQINGLLVVGVFITLARTPIGGAVLAADPLHVLWPVTGLVWLAITWGAWRSWMARRPAAAHSAARPVAVRILAGIALLAVLAASTATATLTRTFGGFGEGLMDPIQSLESPTVEAARGRGRVEVAAGGWAARLYARGAVIESLERAGIDTQTPDVNRPSRRYANGRAADTKIWVLSGATLPRQPEPNARLIAKANLRSPAERAQFLARRERLRGLLDKRGTIVLVDGPRIRRRDLGREYFRWPEPPTGSSTTIPADWLSVDAYVDLFRAGMIQAPRAEQSLVDALFEDSVGRYFVARDEVIAVYLLPADP